jgi:hypothetical protein
LSKDNIPLTVLDILQPLLALVPFTHISEPEINTNDRGLPDNWQVKLYAESVPTSINLGEQLI